MDKINKYQTFVILLAVITGLAIGRFAGVAAYAGAFVVPLLVLMLFGLFLSMDVGDVRKSMLNVRFSLANLVINFVWTPLFAYVLSSLFLPDSPALWIGFVMLMVTPCTDWYLVFTGIARGNVPLSAAILPANLVLQVVLLPVYLLLFFGETGQVAFGPLAGSILFVLVLPFVVAYLVKKYRVMYTGPASNIFRFLESSQVLFLALAVLAMFASEGQNIVDNPRVIYQLLVPILVFFAVTFVLGLVVGNVLKFNRADQVSLVMTTMARNSPIALAIAVSAFPSEPLIALSLVIGPLIELPVLVLAAQALLKVNR